jgi:phosphate uptake regulator
MLCLDHWIAGARDHGCSDRAGTVYNPATGEAFAEVPFATREDVDRAVAAALDAFDRLDPVASAAVIRQDQEMDAEYAAALRRILTRAMEDVRHTQAAIEAAFIMRSLERIGDHARNIARHVGFIGGEFDPTATGVLPTSFSVKN